MGETKCVECGSVDAELSRNSDGAWRCIDWEGCQERQGKRPKVDREPKIAAVFLDEARAIRVALGLGDATNSDGELFVARRIEHAYESGKAYRDPGEPIPMLLWCPSCGSRHVDEGEFVTKSHHTHACQGCGMVWRPAVVVTVGVKFLPGFKNEVPS